eukprot:Nk52_evm1s1299 gene=Nk52_evmTU1s1299
MRSVTIIALIALCACIVVLLPLSVQGESEKKNAKISIGLQSSPVEGFICYEGRRGDEDCNDIPPRANPIELKTGSEDGTGTLRLRKVSSFSKYKEFVEIEFVYDHRRGKESITYTLSDSDTLITLYPTRKQDRFSECKEIFNGGESKCKIDTPMTFNYVR